jgi:hypothetical protein
VARLAKRVIWRQCGTEGAVCEIAVELLPALRGYIENPLPWRVVAQSFQRLARFPFPTHKTVDCCMKRLHQLTRPLGPLRRPYPIIKFWLDRRMPGANLGTMFRVSYEHGRAAIEPTENCRITLANKSPNWTVLRNHEHNAVSASAGKIYCGLMACAILR